MTKEHNQSKCTAFHLNRRWNTVRFFTSLLVVAGLILLAHSLGIVLCPLKRFLGIPCPTCGSTRAVLCLLRCDFHSAFQLQPLVMTLVAASGPVVLAAKLSQRAKRLLASMALHPLTWFLGALAVIANWVYVIMHGN